MTARPAARVTIVNHNSVDIERPANVVWQEILESYVDGRKFGAQGYAIESLSEDPASLLGGYRMTYRDAAGKLLDERVCRITERDENAMRLSLCAEYAMPAEMRLVVNATYQAIPTAGGSRYELHAYSTFDVALPADAAEPGPAQVADQFRSSSSGHLDTYLRSVKERLESQG